MAGKKSKNKGQTVSQPDANRKIKKKASKVEATNALVPAPAPLSGPDLALVSAPATLSGPELAPVSALATNRSEAASQGKGKDKNNSERHSGFIFLCNGRTKPECYQYGVFGLPGGKREVLEKINVGTKLFLFDIDLKLLYGAYDATSSGKLNLEPAAFGGRFPAQVRFKIYKDCLPLPESSFRHAIRDNYQGTKFSQELNAQQVRNLLSLFRPVAASSSAPVPPPIPYMVRLQEMPPPVLEDQFQPSVRFPLKDPYLAGTQHGHAPSVMEPLPVQQSSITSQHEWYRTNTTMGHIHPIIEQQRLPAPSDPYYLAETRQPFLVADSAQTVQDPFFSARYRPVQQMVPHDQFIGLDSEHHGLPLHREREIVLQRGYYNSSMHASPYARPPVQPNAPASGRLGLSGGNFPVSSYYSFAGASQINR